MIDHMAQRADQQIEAGLYERQQMEDRIQDDLIKKKAVLDFCYGHLDKMWAAKVAGFLLGCDFRDAKEHSDLFFEKCEELGI